MADGGGENAMMTSEFRPGPSTERAYRDALGCYGTGVTVVTCETPSGPLAITANSFASVSLDPPLVLWSPAIASPRHDAFVAAPHFSIHILSSAQGDLARRFARDGTAFEGLSTNRTAEGVVALPEVLVRLDCHHHAAHGAGDHTIVLGLVDNVAQGAGSPLLFSQGAYGGFCT